MPDASPAPLPNIHKNLFADPPAYLCLLCTADTTTAPELAVIEAHVRDVHGVEPVLTLAAQGALEPVTMSEARKPDDEHPAHPHGGPPGQTGDRPEHPHGGPPGQDKPEEDENEPHPEHPIVVPDPDDPHVEHHDQPEKE